MSEFRRRLMMAGKKGTDEYVKDGLIHWWDGIWNKEEGVHDGDSLVWYDLVGNNNMTLVKSTLYSDNSIYFTANSLYIPIADRLTYAILDSSVTEAKMTLEVCLNVPMSGKAIFACNTSKTNGYFAYRNNATYQFSNTGYTKKKVSSMQLLSCTYENGNAYENGVLAEDSTTTATNYNVGRIGVNFSSASNGQSISNGHIYCIRIYDRTLSLQEINNNYNIDKQRFNLS